MKFKALLMTMILAAGVAATVAVAKGPPPGVGAGPPAESPGAKAKEKAKAKGKAKKAGAKGNGCVPGAIQLHGELVSVSGGSLTLKVERTNRQGWSLQGKDVAVEADERTQVLRYGPAELEDLEPGDRVLVLAQCKSAESGSTSGGGSDGSGAQSLDPPSGATFVAWLVVATSAGGEGDDEGEGEGSANDPAP